MWINYKINATTISKKNLDLFYASSIKRQNSIRFRLWVVNITHLYLFLQLPVNSVLDQFIAVLEQVLTRYLCELYSAS